MNVVLPIGIRIKITPFITVLVRAVVPDFVGLRVNIGLSIVAVATDLHITLVAFTGPIGCGIVTKTVGVKV